MQCQSALWCFSFEIVFHSVSQCYNGYLDLNRCSRDDDLILIVDSFQGRSRALTRNPPASRRRHQLQLLHPLASTCRYDANDVRGHCIDDVTDVMSERLERQCTGRPRCRVEVDVGWMDSCQMFAHYAHVVYQCIPRQYNNYIIICYNIIKY